VKPPILFTQDFPCLHQPSTHTFQVLHFALVMETFVLGFLEDFQGDEADKWKVSFSIVENQGIVEMIHKDITKIGETLPCLTQSTSESHNSAQISSEKDEFLGINRHILRWWGCPITSKNRHSIQVSSSILGRRTWIPIGKALRGHFGRRFPDLLHHHSLGILAHRNWGWFHGT